MVIFWCGFYYVFVSKKHRHFSVFNTRILIILRKEEIGGY